MPAFVLVSVAGLRGSPITLSIRGATLRIETRVDVERFRAIDYVEWLLPGKSGPHAERVDVNLLPLFQPDELFDHLAKHEAVDESPVVVHEHCLAHLLLNELARRQNLDEFAVDDLISGTFRPSIGMN